MFCASVVALCVCIVLTWERQVHRKVFLSVCRMWLKLFVYVAAYASDVALCARMFFDLGASIGAVVRLASINGTIQCPDAGEHDVRYLSCVSAAVDITVLVWACCARPGFLVMLDCAACQRCLQQCRWFELCAASCWMWTCVCIYFSFLWCG